MSLILFLQRNPFGKDGILTPLIEEILEAAFEGEMDAYHPLNCCCIFAKGTTFEARMTAFVKRNCMENINNSIYNTVISITSIEIANVINVIDEQKLTNY